MDVVLVLAPLVVLTACTVRGVFGFGEALVGMPLLLLFAPPKMATAMMAVMGLLQGIAMLAREWRSIEWSASRTMLAAATLGVPVGLFALDALPVVWVKRALAILLIAYASQSLLGAALPKIRSQRVAALAGFASGALGGAYNFAGPPVILYTSMARWEPARTRATLQAFFAPLSLVIVIGHVIAGSYTPDVLELTVISAPCVALGTLIGGAISKRVDASMFRTVFDATLIVLGVILWL